MSIDVFLNIIMAAMIIEAIFETIKLLFKDLHYTWLWGIFNIVISILVCFNYNLDLLGALGFKDHIPYLGVILTGVLISRGSTFIHDLIIQLTTKPSNPLIQASTNTIEVAKETTITKI